jgi:[acyl-carrier-protein] S-malonyltransferase
MFSGQGSEYLDMCHELYDQYDIVKKVFDVASNTLGYDVSDILFFNEAKLKDTRYTQPLLFVMYVSIVKLLKSFNIESTHTLGLSIGEYGALYDSGVITFDEGLNLLLKRGEYMKNVCDKTNGKMSAILGLDADVLNKIIEQVEGYAVIANYNTYGQLVISGDENTVIKVNEVAMTKGARRCIMLTVNGAFHSDLMLEASELFSECVEKHTFKEPNKKLLVNTTGSFFECDMEKELVNQISSSVRFYQMIENCLEDEVTNFIEIGPRKSLCSFVKKINRNVNIMNVEDLESLNKTLESLVK